MNIKIAHLTSAHSRYDTRIFIKQCSSLANVKEYEVTLIVADGKGNETKNDVKIIDVGNLLGRIKRIFQTTKKVYQKAIELNASIYQIHDPELLPVALKLKKRGKKVIFDSHEDVSKQMLSKPYLTKFLLKVISITYRAYENYVCKKLDFIITATPYIRDRFISLNKNTIDVNNYPLLNELKNKAQWEKKKNEVCYVGGIAKIRGIIEVVKGLGNIRDGKLNLVGSFESETLRAETKIVRGWKNVKELGFLNREQVSEVLSRSKAGLVTFHPLPNHIDAQPNKMFEYMSAGIPVIASNFTLWREIIEGNNCGICVDPLKPQEIAKAIEHLLENSKKAQLMGQNGRKAVEEKYNWAIEEKKLLNIYNALSKQK